MMRKAAFLLPLLAMVALPAALHAQAQEPQLVPDVSTNAIDIQYSFSGEDLLLFGAILYPGGRLPDSQADIVVVLKGPSGPVTLREKQRIAGVWINAESARFRSVPGYYAIASSRPIDRLVDERTAAIYELGLKNLQLSPGGTSDAKESARFERGLIQLNESHQLFDEQPDAVEIREGVLYRARIAIPARVPVGHYTAETFLVSKGRVLAVASRDIVIRKSGFERFVADSAQRYGFLYGLVAILVSLAFGYAGAFLFQKRG